MNTYVCVVVFDFGCVASLFVRLHIRRLSMRNGLPISVHSASLCACRLSPPRSATLCSPRSIAIFAHTTADYAPARVPALSKGVSIVGY